MYLLHITLFCRKSSPSSSVAQAGSPLKGEAIQLAARKLLKLRIPDIKIEMSGKEKLNRRNVRSFRQINPSLEASVIIGMCVPGAYSLLFDPGATTAVQAS
jgi:hypothetical protein